MTGSGADARVPAIARTFAIMRVLGSARKPLKLGVLARAVSAPKSSVVGLCRALVAEQLLVRGDDGRYWIGPRWVEFAAAYRRMVPRVKHIGFTVRRMSNPFHAAQAAAAERLAAQLQARITVLDANMDPSRQQAHIERFLDEGVDLILVEPVSSDVGDAAVRRAKEEPVPLIALGARLAGAALTVASDDIQAGQLAGQHAARMLSGEGQVVIFAGRRLSAITDRLRGFTAALDAHPGISVVVDDRTYTDGDDAGDQLAARVRDSAADLIFTTNDQLALRVSHAMSVLDRTVPIVSIDGSRAAVEQVLCSGPIIATVAQSPVEIIERAFDLGIALRDGTQFAAGTVLLPTSIITAATAKGVPEW